jgi:hypothetical protein
VKSNIGGVSAGLAWSLVVLTCPALADKPTTRGVYVDAGGQSHEWYITSAHALVWDKEPFIPFGTWFVSHYLDRGTSGRWRDDVQALELLKSKGITDYYIGWSNQKPKLYQRLIDWFEANGCTYGIIPARYDWEPLVGYKVMPGQIAVSSAGRYTATVKTGQTHLVRAFYLLLNEAGDVVQTGTVDAQPGDSCELVFDVTPPEAGKHTLCYVPVVRCAGMNGFDWWTGYARHRENVVAFLKALRLGPGLRLMIDPFFNEEGFYWGTENVIPDSDAYRAAFQAWLRKQYDNVAALNQAWSVTTSPIASFEQAARLVPVMVGQKGGNTGYLWDPAQNAAFKVDLTTSIVVHDLLQARDDSYADLHNDMSDAMKGVVNVPIVFKRTGWQRRGFVNRRESGGFDGAGLEVYKAGDDYYVPTGIYLGELGQSAKTMWYVTTETNYKDESKPKPQGIGYPSKELMFAALDRQMQLGVKGFYLFAAQPQNGRKIFEEEYDLLRVPEQYDWFVEYKRRILGDRTRWTTYEPRTHYFFPVNSPDLRETGDLSGQGLPMAPWPAPDGTWVLPTYTPFVATDRLFACVDTPTLCRKYGRLLDEAIRSRTIPIVYLGLLGMPAAVPSLDQYFTHERVIEDGITYQVLRPDSDARVLARTRSGQAWALERNGLMILARDGAMKELSSAGKPPKPPWPNGSQSVEPRILLASASQPAAK